MKKIKNILLSVFAIVTVAVLTPNVNASEFETDFVSNITIVTEGNKYAIKFDLKKGLSLQEGKNSSFNISIYYTKDGDTSSYYSGTGAKIIDNSLEFTATEQEGTRVYGQDLTVGMTIAQYMDLTSMPEYIDAIANNKAYFDISISDENYNYEYITYEIKNNTIIKVDKGHDYESELIDKLAVKYPNIVYGRGEGPMGEPTPETDIKFSLENKISEEKYSYQEITIKNYKDKTVEQICAEIEEQIKTSEFNMSIYENETTIDNTVLENIKNSQKKTNISEYLYDDATGKVSTLYTWTFDGSKITDTNFNLNLKINVGTSKSKETIDTLVPEKEKSLVLEFLYHGALPTGTTVKINVLGKYNNGDLVTLYYYNEETKALEMVAKNLEVKDGFVEVGLEHCSEYVLAYQPELIVDNLANDNANNGNNAQTSSMSVVKYGSIGVISLLTAIYLVVNKKKTA